MVCKRERERERDERWFTQDGDREEIPSMQVREREERWWT